MKSDFCYTCLSMYLSRDLAHHQTLPLCIAFGSTYAREVAFADEDWLKRARNPLAQTFVVVRSRDRAILAATTLMGPLPLHRTKPASLLISENDSNNNNNHSATHDGKLNNDTTSTTTDGADAPLSYEVSGVYTRREARGRGFGTALMHAAAVERAAAEARLRGRRRFEIKTIVYATNAGAVAFYEKRGFVTARARQNVNPLKGPEPVTELDMYFRSDVVL